MRCVNCSRWLVSSTVVSSSLVLVCLSCSSIAVCGDACVSVRFDVASTGGRLQFQYNLACHYKLHSCMLLFITTVRLRFVCAGFASSASSGAFCKCGLFVATIAFSSCRCVVAFGYISIRSMRLLALAWQRGMRCVERVAVVACGPVFVFVSVCGRVKCTVLFVVRPSCVRQLRICVLGFSLLASRLYKPFARKPWLNGLPRACTSARQFVL